MTTQSYFINRVVNTAAWGDYTDSDDDEPIKPATPVTKPATPVTKPATTATPVTTRTWAKLSNESPTATVPATTATVPATTTTESRSTLMVKNLPRDTTPQKLAIELRSFFKTYGPIKDVYIPINRDGVYAGTIKGFAKLQFHQSAHAALAVKQSLTIRNNRLSIEYANQDR